MNWQHVKTGRFLKVAVWVTTLQQEWQKTPVVPATLPCWCFQRSHTSFGLRFFFRMNIWVFKRLFKHGTAGAPYFLSQKKINAAKAADVSSGFGVDGSNDETTSMVKDGKDFANNRVVGRKSFGTREGCIQERPRNRFCVCYPFEELWSQHFKLQSTFIKEKQRVGFTSKWTSKVYTLLEDWQKMLPFLSYRGCPIILDRAVLCRDIRKASRFGLEFMVEWCWM